jgi:hypothetical protein
MAMGSKKPGAVAYRQVHDLLEEHGFVLMKLFTNRPGRSLVRIYRRLDGVLIRFPTAGRVVSYAIYENILRVLSQYDAPGAAG